METPDSESANSAEELSIEQRSQNLATQLDIEQKMWNNEQIHPGMVAVDPYHMNIVQKTLIRIVQERFGITEEEINLLFREEYLKQLQHDRREIVRQRNASVVVAHKQLFGPDGRPMSNGK